MDAITIDGLHEDAFRQSIEDLLRRGLANEAASRLRSLLEPYTGEGEVFPARFLSVSPEDIEITGWQELDEGLAKFDRPETPVTAICLSFGDPEGRGIAPDGAGLLSLTVETSYFSDEAFPFSESDRNDLLDGYSAFGCQWAGDCEGVDHAIAFRGADDLYGSLAGLEQRLLSSHNPEPEEIRAGTIASCYLSVLFHLALRESMARRRLGRPLCVLTANNGVYPSFDAPVLSCDEYLAGGEVVAVAAAVAPEWVADDSYAPPHKADEEDEEAPEEASLLSIGIRRTAKQPVLALADGDDELSFEAMQSAALGMGGSLPPMPPADPAYSWNEPEPEPEEHGEPEPEPEAEAEAELAPDIEPMDVFEDSASFIEVQENSLPERDFGPGSVDLFDQVAQDETVDEPAPEAELEEAFASAPDEPGEAPVELLDEPVETAAPSESDAEPEARAEAEAEAEAGYQLGDTEWPAREAEEPAAAEPEPTAPEWQAADEAEEPLRPAPQPAGHSLRARLGVAEGEPVLAEKPSIWSRLVDWIEAKLRRK
ncbi:MAG: hypothetical protein ACKOPO_08710 [Novosphingobium sp.]